MSIEIDIQNDYKKPLTISMQQIRQWAHHAIMAFNAEAEVTIRLTDEAQIQYLNQYYRGKDKPTNVLSFPYKIPDSVDLERPFLGDVIICPDVLQLEARSQQIPYDAHFAHLVVHGILHLLGYDHIEENDATIMQALEVKLLKQLGYNNPYEVNNEPSC